MGQYAFKGAIEMSRFCSVFRKGSPLPLLSVFQPFLLTFSHLPHPSAISSSFSGPLMSVCRPLCLASPSTFCHCTASPILAACDLFGQLSHRKRKKKKKIRQCGMKRKSWQGTKDAVNYSDTSRRFLKGVGRSVQGSDHPSPPRVQVSVPPARHGCWLP